MRSDITSALAEAERAAMSIRSRVERPGEMLETIKTKQDPLPYSRAHVAPHERECQFCGPPFERFTPEEMLHPFTMICSYHCGKRYVSEVLAKPYGFKVKHSSTAPDHRTGCFPISLHLIC